MENFVILGLENGAIKVVEKSTLTEKAE